MKILRYGGLTGASTCSAPSMSTSRYITRGGLSAIALLALVVGVPVGLGVLAGWPLPSETPSADALSDVLGRQMSFDEVNAVLAVVGWVLWAQFLWCTSVELLAWKRNASPGRVRFAGGSQALARSLSVPSLT